MARQGHLWNDGSLWRWRAPPADLMPVTVEALIERALREVSGTEALRDTLGAHAPLPHTADQTLLAAVVNLSPEALAGAQEELERQAVLLRGQLTHPLYSEVALKGLDPERTAGMARRAIAALEHVPQEMAALIDEARLDPPAAAALLIRAAKGAGNAAQHARLLGRAAQYASGAQQLHLMVQAVQGLRDGGAALGRAGLPAGPPAG
ncbi:hypothetical protein [Deinococcus hopiensis]|uniref:hypothetical protein n=1 Tax=Deinococcus hopiensis TaxID=309885 RepID=UPI00111C6A6C|nr:hypothetical protein [Deinococcus hopiensis]